MKKIGYIAAALIFSSMLSLTPFDAMAAGENISVTVDNANPIVGETVTITVTAYSDVTIAAGGYKVYVNGQQLGGEVDYNDGASLVNSFSYTVAAEGTYEVTLGPLEDTSTGGVELIPFDETTGSFQDAVPINPGTVRITAAMPTATPTPEPTATPTPEPTATPTPEPTATPTPEPTATPTPEPTPTETPAPTPTEVPAEITGLEVLYIGGEKRVGESVSGIELSVLAVYENGTSQPVSGWGCDQVGQPLQEGENVFVVRYQNFSEELIINAVSNAADTTEESSENATTAPTEETTGETATEGETDTERIPYIQVVSPFGGDDLYLASDWSVDVPEGFEEDEITYSGYAVKVVRNENGLTLAYMTDREGNNGQFYIYDEDSQKFSYYTGIPATAGTFYILSIPDDFDDTGLVKMSLSINGNTFDAYQLSDSQADGIVCLVYAVNEEGVKGFYRFDTELRTFVRYYADLKGAASDTDPDANESTSSNTSDADAIRQQYEELAEQYTSESWLKFYIIVALIVLAVILFIFVIILAMKLRKIYNEYDFIDEEEEEDTEEDEGDEEYDAGDDEEDDGTYMDEDFRVDLSGIADEDDDEL